MISAILIYNQSIHSSTGFTPFHLIYGPYERNIEFDLDMTILEQYNERRRQELIPFYDHVYRKNKEKAERILDKRNTNKDLPPDVTNKEVYVERNRPRKTDPPFEKITVTEQDENKITGLTTKNRSTTANIQKIKRLRKNANDAIDKTVGNPTPDPDPEEPGPSGN